MRDIYELTPDEVLILRQRLGADVWLDAQRAAKACDAKGALAVLYGVELRGEVEPTRRPPPAWLENLWQE